MQKPFKKSLNRTRGLHRQWPSWDCSQWSLPSIILASPNLMAHRPRDTYHSTAFAKRHADVASQQFEDRVRCGRGKEPTPQDFAYGTTKPKVPQDRHRKG